jgi:hypothetical protein
MTLFEQLTSNLTYDQWQMMRAGRFTASIIKKLMPSPTKEEIKAGEVLSKGAKTVVYEAVHEYLTGQKREIGSVWALEYGIINEPYAVAEFEQVTGLQVEHWGGNVYRFFPYGKRAGGSPDGKIVGMSKGIEIKCPESSSIVQYLAYGAKAIDEDYLIQIQANLLFTGFESMYLIIYDGRIRNPIPKIAYFEIFSDKEMQDQIKTKLDAASKLFDEVLESIVKRNNVELEKLVK